ncbi:MAG: DMT family transporter [Anaerococcus vaginalis]|uniref:DMT family transporter n=1 Tax=Anaerococcus vaginalis TaxID=33037 RepID=UPI0029060F08|nr:DMT family transporter [Anaerococcus vaginalis]MDU4446812.1 DMT family transporter [Anaerococcus vaginalis]MDU6182656.1 DMT family transporter [Anaerococcus vaginalis]MDU7433090.1 DMT family transporter [Anaerococcus vaginalis]
MKNKKMKAIISALLAAVLFAISTPLSKKLMENIPPTFMAAFLYLGAGVGVGIMYIFNYKKEDKSLKLDKSDFKYTIAMIGLDILAPLLLMLGIKLGSASNASLLENFEIVATSLIALIIFKEKISYKLWIAIFFIIISSFILTFDDKTSLDFSIGSIFVLLATISWGLENNCTKKISEKSTYQIVTLKGIFSGLGSLFIGFLLKEKIINYKYIFLAMILGFVAYGLSIFLYVRAQRDLGAAKTSAYYSVAPFVGAFLAFLINGERPDEKFLLALIFMIIGTIFVIYDSLVDNKIK